MRMWNLNPRKMCNQHLLGEHVELHMFVGCINKKIKLKGYVNKGLVEIHNIKKRHFQIAKEMIRREFNHNSELPKFKVFKAGKINTILNKKELNKRCKKCFK